MLGQNKKDNETIIGPMKELMKDKIQPSKYRNNYFKIYIIVIFRYNSSSRVISTKVGHVRRKG